MATVAMTDKSFDEPVTGDDVVLVHVWQGRSALAATAAEGR